MELYSSFWISDGIMHFPWIIWYTLKWLVMNGGPLAYNACNYTFKIVPVIWIYSKCDGKLWTGFGLKAVVKYLVRCDFNILPYLRFQKWMQLDIWWYGYWLRNTAPDPNVISIFSDDTTLYHRKVRKDHILDTMAQSVHICSYCRREKQSPCVVTHARCGNSDCRESQINQLIGPYDI